MDFRGQFRNLNPVSRAMGNLNDHKYSEESRLDGQRLDKDKEVFPLS